MTPRTTPRRRRGMSIMELLVALAITAVLLTAVAVATDASFKAYRVNQEHAALTQNARVAMNRMLSTIRSAREHAPYETQQSADFATGLIVSASGIAMFGENDTEISFRHDSATQRVIACVDGVDHTMAEGVTAFAVRMEPMRSAASLKTHGPWDLLRRATITMTLRTTAATATHTESIGSQTVTLSASTMPRRNCW